MLLLAVAIFLIALAVCPNILGTRHKPPKRSQTTSDERRRWFVNAKTYGGERRRWFVNAKTYGGERRRWFVNAKTYGGERPRRL
jgi:hypothetical protein